MQPILSVLSIFAASIPMLCFVAFVWWFDRFDREPFHLVVRTFLLGALVSVVLAMVLSPVVHELIHSTGASALSDGRHRYYLRVLTGPVLTAPLVEEPLKALVLLPILFNEEFDNMTDGFVYGCAAGLGFAMSENFLYFLSGVTDDTGAWLSLVFLRTFYSGIMHAIATASIGAALGYARWSGPWAMFKFGLVGFLVALVIHMVWNGLFVVDSLVRSNGSLSSLNLLLFPLEILLAWGTFLWCIWREQATLIRELEEEVSLGAIPAGHPQILASWWLRTRSGWLPAGVPQWSYIYHANLLAMRKWQVRARGAAPLQRHVDEVALHREEIRRILSAEEAVVENRRATLVTSVMRRVRGDDE